MERQGFDVIYWIDRKMIPVYICSILLILYESKINFKSSCNYKSIF